MADVLCEFFIKMLRKVINIFISFDIEKLEDGTVVVKMVFFPFLKVKGKDLSDKIENESKNSSKVVDNVKTAINKNVLEEVNSCDKTSKILSDKIFICTDTQNNYYAKGQYLEGGKFLVLKDAIIRNKPVKSFSEYGAKEMRDALIEKNIIAFDGKSYILQENCEFGSPTTASSVVSGGSESGLIKWKTEDGELLKDFLEKLNNN